MAAVNVEVRATVLAAAGSAGRPDGCTRSSAGRLLLPARGPGRRGLATTEYRNTLHMPQQVQAVRGWILDRVIASNQRRTLVTRISSRLMVAQAGGAEEDRLVVQSGPRAGARCDRAAPGLAGGWNRSTSVRGGIASSCSTPMTVATPRLRGQGDLGKAAAAGGASIRRRSP